MKFSMLFLVFLWGVFGLSAQKSTVLSGKVVEKESGLPMAFATLNIALDNGTQITGYTDENGKFNIYDLPVGELKITVENIGYYRSELYLINLKEQQECIVLNLEEKKRTS